MSDSDTKNVLGFSELVTLAERVQRESLANRERKIEKVVKKIRELGNQLEGLKRADILEHSHLLESSLLRYIPDIIKQNFKRGSPVVKFFELFYRKRDEMENVHYRLLQAINSKHPQSEIEILKEVILRQKCGLVSILNNAPVGIPQMIIEICLYAVQKPIFLK